MDKLEKVIKGLKYCIDYGKRIKDICNGVPCEGCPYCKYRDIRVGYGDCIDRLHSDAIDILKAQNEAIQKYKKADTFLDAHGWKWE